MGTVGGSKGTGYPICINCCHLGRGLLLHFLMLQEKEDTDIMGVCVRVCVCVCVCVRARMCVCKVPRFLKPGSVFKNIA